MTKSAAYLTIAGAFLAFAATAQAADLPTTKAPPAPPLAPSCFSSLYDFMNSTPKDCPLSYWGITFYGVIDVGVGYSSHGANFNPDYPQGVAEVIAKYSQGSKFQIVPNGLQRSNVGLGAKEEFAPNWFFVGNINTDFDPYSLRLANGPASLVDNNTRTLADQSANSDSSRAGQFDNTQGYVGVSNSVFGTLTAGRLNSFSVDAVTNYDAMVGSYAFCSSAILRLTSAASAIRRRPATKPRSNISGQATTIAPGPFISSAAIRSAMDRMAHCKLTSAGTSVTFGRRYLLLRARCGFAVALWHGPAAEGRQS